MIRPFHHLRPRLPAVSLPCAAAACRCSCRFLQFCGGEGAPPSLRRPSLSCRGRPCRCRLLHSCGRLAVLLLWPPTRCSCGRLRSYRCGRLQGGSCDRLRSYLVAAYPWFLRTACGPILWPPTPGSCNRLRSYLGGRLQCGSWGHLRLLIFVAAYELVPCGRIKPSSMTRSIKIHHTHTV